MSGPVELVGMRLTFVSARTGRLSQLPEGFAESVIAGLHSLVMSVFHGPNSNNGTSPPGIIDQWEHGSLFREPLGGVPTAILLDVPSTNRNTPRNTVELLCSLKPVVRAYDERFYDIIHSFTSFCSLGVSGIVTEMSPELQPKVEVLVKGSQQANSDSRFPGFRWEESDFSLKPRLKVRAYKVVKSGLLYRHIDLEQQDRDILCSRKAGFMEHPPS